jgi:hypothetical protein
VTGFLIRGGKFGERRHRKNAIWKWRWGLEWGVYKPRNIRISDNPQKLEEGSQPLQDVDILSSDFWPQLVVFWSYSPGALKRACLWTCHFFLSSLFWLSQATQLIFLRRKKGHLSLLWYQYFCSTHTL